MNIKKIVVANIPPAPEVKAVKRDDDSVYRYVEESLTVSYIDNQGKPRTINRGDELMYKYEKALIESNKHLTRENQLIFNELVERATPKKPELLYPQVYECPVCNDSLLRSNLYCPSCGQALDWSE